MSQGGIGIWVGVWDPAAWVVASLGFSVLGAAWKSCLCVVCVCVYQSLSVLNWCGFRLSWGRTLNPKPRLRLHCFLSYSRIDFEFAGFGVASTGLFFLVRFRV